MNLVSKKEIRRNVKINIKQQLRYAQICKDAETYPEKDNDDDIVCVVCCGKYKRSQRCMHLSTKMHKRALDMIYERYVK